MDEGNRMIISNRMAYAAAPEKNSKKKWIIIGIVVGVLLIVGIVVAVILLNSNNRNNETVNLRGIFDQTSPIPAANGESYGYISSGGGSFVIEAQYSYAERFYGEYAKVATRDGGGNKYGVINRSGKMVAEADENSADESSVEYFVDQNLWKVGTAMYDGSMNKITKNGEVADYISNGYMRVKNAGEDYYNRIMDRNGEVLYTCTGTPCTVMISSDFNNNGEYYAAVQNADGSSVLLYLKDGSEVMKLEAGRYFIGNGNNIFGVKVARGALEKQFLALGGAVKKEFPAAASLSLYGGRDVVRIINGNNESYYDVKNDSIVSVPAAEWASEKVYPSSELTINQCDDGRYGLSRGSEELLACEYDDILFPPKNVFEYYSTIKGKEYVVLIGSEVTLYDAKSNNTVRNFANDDVEFFENSVFYLVGGQFVYSLESSTGDGAEVLTAQTIEYFGNYFVVDFVTYGPALTVIKGSS